MNFERNNILDHDQMVKALRLHEYPRYKHNLELDLKSREMIPTRPSIEEPQVMKLKSLPTHLRYVLLYPNNTLPMIITADHDEE